MTAAVTGRLARDALVALVLGLAAIMAAGALEGEGPLVLGLVLAVAALASGLAFTARPRPWSLVLAAVAGAVAAATPMAGPVGTAARALLASGVMGLAAFLELGHLRLRLGAPSGRAQAAAAAMRRRLLGVLAWAYALVLVAALAPPFMGPLLSSTFDGSVEAASAWGILFVGAVVALSVMGLSRLRGLRRAPARE